MAPGGATNVAGSLVFGVGTQADNSLAGTTVRARFADPFPLFNPQGNETAETTAICTLTLACTQHDSHPSDAGYRALASLVWNASGYHRLR